MDVPLALNYIEIRQGLARYNAESLQRSVTRLTLWTFCFL